MKTKRQFKYQSKLMSFVSKRRDELFKKLPDDSILIIPNKEITIKSNDVENKYKPSPDFYYLTGFEEPNSICILKKEKRKNTFIMFVEPFDKDKEVWVGKCTGINGARSTYKADLAFSTQDFDKEIKKLLYGAKNIYYPIGSSKEFDKKIIALIEELSKSSRSGHNTAKSISDPRHLIHKMRLIKDDYEIECMQIAADITKSAHFLAMTYACKGIYEYELEALLEYKFRISGGLGPAYPSIVCSGTNCTTLHYIKNNKKIDKNDFILIDAGCEYKQYAADVTRTFPVNKKFSGAQKELYEIVLEAQLKSIKSIKPGVSFIDSHNKALLIIINGLKELGLLKGSTEQIIKKGDYKKFFMHKLSHWLGLDVHDAGPYFDENGDSIKLKPGMIMTVEPGIYISTNNTDVPKAFRGIGIRIEDDILVTKTGNRVLTEGIPKTINEIESLNIEDLEFTQK